MGQEFPFRIPPRDFSDSESLSFTDTNKSANDLWDQISCDKPNYKQLKLLVQAQLNNLTGDLYLSKESAELLESRLCENNCNLLVPESR